MYKNLKDLIITNKKVLKSQKINSYQIDSTALIELSTGISKERQIIHENKKLNYTECKANNLLLERRFKSEPIAYILESKEFYSNSFYVNRNSLVPRPETELIVDSLIEYFNSDSLVDVCTGSGCIPISYLCESNSLMHCFRCTDLSSASLKVAVKNLKLSVKSFPLDFYLSDLFKGLTFEAVSCITCNPPYIPKKDYTLLMDDVKKFEPEMALVGGMDGLDFYRRLAKEAYPLLTQNGIIILEIGASQKEDVIYIFRKSDYILCESIKDIAGIDRTLIFRKG